MKQFNEWLALRMSAIFATMWCFWVVEIVVLLPLVWPRSLPFVQFVSSGWFQAIALPLLAVSGVIIGRKADARAEADHQAIMELVAALHDKHDALNAKIEGSYNDGR
ncbi:MAG: hypothetical protein PHZ23_16355 [Acidiphilium sp.]|nr:hypothetical protein [Acidiphilium sp.]